MKTEYLFVSNWSKFYDPTLNEEIIKNKNILRYSESNDKRWFNLQNITLKETSAVTEIANLCLESDNKNEVIHSKDGAVKSLNGIILLGKVNDQMTFERKERLKNALS